MSNTYLYLLIALAAGAMLPTQAGVNNRLAAFVDGPVIAAFLSFLVGTISLLVYLLLTGASLGSISGSRQAPLFAWTGGLIGAFFVTATIVLVPRIGMAMTFSLVVAGQMLVTLVIDHFGLLGVEVRPVNWQRIAGVLLVTGGVVLVRRF